MAYRGYVPFNVDPESLRAGRPSSVRAVVANLAFAGAQAGARGLKRKFFQAVMSQGENVAVAGLSAVGSLGAGEVSKIARTVASDVGGIPVDAPTISPSAAANIRARTRVLFGRGRARVRGRVTRTSRRRRPYRRSRLYPVRRRSYRNTRYGKRSSRRRYY